MPALRILTLIILFLSGATARADGIAWQPWSEQVFATAAREDKLVLLDMEAVWCHWCHVMDETTYKIRRWSS